MFQKLLTLLVALTALAALAGVYSAHYGPEGLVFGSTNGSLSLLAFAVNTAIFWKMMRKCCAGCMSSCGCGPMPKGQ